MNIRLARRANTTPSEVMTTTVPETTGLDTDPVNALTHLWHAPWPCTCTDCRTRREIVTLRRIAAGTAEDHSAVDAVIRRAHVALPATACDAGLDPSTIT